MNLAQWKAANYDKRVEFLKDQAFEWTKKDWKIEVIPDDQFVINNYYSNCDDTIYLKNTLLESDSLYFKAIESLSGSITAIKQAYLRNHPEECKTPLDAVEYEITCEIGYSDGISFRGSRSQEEIRKSSYYETRKFCLLNGDNNTPEYKDYLKEIAKLERSFKVKLSKEFGSDDYQKKVEYENYKEYQRLVSKKQKMLEKENEVIELKIFKLKEQSKDQTVSFETVNEIDQLKQQLELNNNEIKRLATEKTLNPKLGKLFEVYNQKMELYDQESKILLKMEDIERPLVNGYTWGAEALKLVGDCESAYKHVKRVGEELENKSKKLEELNEKSKERKGLSKLKNFKTFIQKVDIKMDIYELKGKYAKAIQEFEESRKQALEGEAQFKKAYLKNLRENPEYMKLRTELGKVLNKQKALEEKAKHTFDKRTGVEHQEYGNRIGLKSSGNGGMNWS
ncbi:MAG TPA: hypothetical protein PLZ08_06450 [Bacillota bacterium]|nr:hypothetical protein [Bacillota bacterium]HOL09856.1 hypothetical protein [Bacillota bacterium]HPO97584.1 hypothetical protein [Bacillota bacterium]